MREIYGIRLESSNISMWKYGLLFMGLMHATGIASRLKIEGGLPTEGPAILTVNHLSYLDPPICYFVAAKLAHRTSRMVARDTMVNPNLPEDPEELARMGKKPTPRLLRHVLSFFANIGDPLSINRSHPTRKSFYAIYSTLELGQIVTFSLQSTRNPKDDLLAVENGAAYIALQNPDIPIYCAGVSGSQLDIRRVFEPIYFKIAEPFTPRERGFAKRTRDSIRLLTEELKRTTALLIPDELKRNYMASLASN